LTIQSTHNISTTVLTLFGYLNTDTADDLGYQVFLFLDEGHEQLLIDLSGVKHLDIHGVMTLRGLIEVMAPKFYGATIKLVVPTHSSLWETLLEYHIHEWADVYPEARYAMESIFS